MTQAFQEVEIKRVMVKGCPGKQESLGGVMKV
jgi:hypothetical protein